MITRIKKWFSLKKSVVVLSILVVLFSILYYFGVISFTSKTTVEAAFAQSSVQLGDLKIEIVSDGNVYLNLKYLDFDVSGKLSKIYVKNGQKFKKGDVLAEINPNDYEDALAKAEIDYQKAQISNQTTSDQRTQNLIAEQQKVIDLKNQLDLKQKAYDEALSQYSALEIPVDDYQSAKTAFDNAKSTYDVEVLKLKALNTNNDIVSSNLSLSQSQMALDKARENLQKTKLIAPADGMILNMSKVEGDSVNTVNNTTNTTASDHFISYIDSNKIIAKSYVAEADIKNISVGLKSDVKIESIGEDVFKGVVTALKSVSKTDSNGIVTYEVTSEFADPNGDIKDGMTALISYIIQGKENVLNIPNKAVTAEEGIQYVEVIDKSGKIIKTEIQTGMSDGEKVEVVTGLKRGENVVIRSGKG